MFSPPFPGFAARWRPSPLQKKQQRDWRLAQLCCCSKHRRRVRAPSRQAGVLRLRSRPAWLPTASQSVSTFSLEEACERVDPCAEGFLGTPATDLTVSKVAPTPAHSGELLRPAVSALRGGVCLRSSGLMFSSAREDKLKSLLPRL